jgi:hypothetical protein
MTIKRSPISWRSSLVSGEELKKARQLLKRLSFQPVGNGTF